MIVIADPETAHNMLVGGAVFVVLFGLFMLIVWAWGR